MPRMDYLDRLEIVGSTFVGTMPAAGQGASKDKPVLMGVLDGSGNVQYLTTAMLSGGGGGGGGVVTQSDQTQLKMTAYQGTSPWITTANIGSTNGLALDTTLTGGGQKTQIVGSTGNVALIDANGLVEVRGGMAEMANLSAAALNADLVPSTDVSAYKSFSLQVGGSGTWAITVQGSNTGNVNDFVTVPAWLISDVLTSARFTALSTFNSIVIGNINYRYLRVRQTAYTSGSASGTLELYATPAQNNAMGVQINNGSAVAQSGAWSVSLAANSTGGYSATHINTNATTTAKSGSGTLHSITINTLGVTNTATIYDNTAGSGTVLAVINTTLMQTTLMYDIAFTTGLTIVTAGGTAADMTIAWK